MREVREGFWNELDEGESGGEADILCLMQFDNGRYDLGCAGN